MYDGSSYRESTVLHKSGKGWSRESVRPEGCVTREEGTNLCGSRARKDTYWQRLHNTSIIGFLDPLKKNPLAVLACVASVSVGFRGIELPRERKRGEGDSNPSFLFWLSPQFRAGKIPFRFRSLVFLCSPTHGNACYAGYGCPGKYSLLFSGRESYNSSILLSEIFILKQDFFEGRQYSQHGKARKWTFT